MTDLRKAAEMALESWGFFFSQAHPEIVGLMYGNDWAKIAKERTEALRQALAQPEQEPVAWADKVGAVIPHSHKLFQPDLLKDYTRPLYTAPPKREWVGLTIEDYAEVNPDNPKAFILGSRWAESKLKEKNG